MVFSEEQKAAIYYKDGPALVLAGPGSGKTTVIVNRIERLIRGHNIEPLHLVHSTQCFLICCVRHIIIQQVQ